MKKNVLLKLRNLLLNFKDIATEEGVTLMVDGDLQVGLEVFAYDDNGDVIVAPDGEYTYENQIIVVKEGVVSEIRDKEVAPEAPAEETPAEEPVVEENAEEETPAEETPAEPEADEKDAKIAELEAKIAQLEAENAELKAKLNEPAADPAEEEFKNQNHDEIEMSAQEKAANIVKFIRNRK